MTVIEKGRQNGMIPEDPATILRDRVKEYKKIGVVNCHQRGSAVCGARKSRVEAKTSGDHRLL